MLCVACKHQDISENQSKSFSNNEETSGIITEESTLENLQAVSSIMLQSSNFSTNEPLCEHAQYTLKENYTDYQEMLKDYNMVLENFKNHQQSSCKTNQRSTLKLQDDSSKMQKIYNELQKTCSSRTLSGEEKLKAIEYSIESAKDDMCWQEGESLRRTKGLLAKRLELKKQYEQGKITVDEYYEKNQQLRW